MDLGSDGLPEGPLRWGSGASEVCVGVRVAMEHSRVDKRCSEKKVDEVRVVEQPRGADGHDVRGDVRGCLDRALDLKCYITPTPTPATLRKALTSRIHGVGVTDTIRTRFPREREREDKEKT